jgi:DNA-binding NarL/FixJ family response regulator
VTIKIIIADDHKIVREGLRALLSREPMMEVVAEAEDGRAALHLVEEHAPDVIIMDIGMVNLNGIEATRQITSEHPYVKVVALSIHADRRFVMEMLKAGASGYLLKDCAFEELAAAIRAVVKGQKYLSPRIAGVVVEEFVGGPKVASPVFSILTAREREVLQLLAEGKTTRQIASHIHVSTKTVETHRQRIMKKLNLNSVAELTKLAIREGLIFLD